MTRVYQKEKVDIYSEKGAQASIAVRKIIYVTDMIQNLKFHLLAVQIWAHPNKYAHNWATDV